MRVEPLNGHNRAGFATGIAELDRYFRAQAARETAKGLAAVFVLLREGRVGGFYCLTPATVLLPDLVGGAKASARYPTLPAAFLPRLGVDQRWRGIGLGRALLEDARTRLRATAPDAVALIAHAPDEAAQSFYSHAGLRSFPDQPSRMFEALRAV